MKNLILLSMLFLTACAKENSIVTTPSEILPYVESFRISSEFLGTPVDVSNIKIVYDGTLPSYVLGRCIYAKENMPAEIHVNKTNFDKLTVASKEQMIFHEMGHCILDRRQHRDDVVIDVTGRYNLKISMMSTAHIESSLYAQNRDAYVMELFLGHTDLPYYVKDAPDKVPYARYGVQTASLGVHEHAKMAYEVNNEDGSVSIEEFICED